MSNLHKNQYHQPHLFTTEQLRISGMHCAACVQLIEFRVRKITGVKQFDINPALQKAHLEWNEQQTSLKKIIEAIVNLGYAAFPANQSEDQIEKKQRRLALWRIFIAGFAMMQVMMYAFPAYLEPIPSIDGDLTPDLDRLLKIASLIICLPVVFFSAQPFFKGAWSNLKNKHIGMDVPVAMGIMITFVASIYPTFHNGKVYYDTVIMFVFFLLSARYIEQKIQAKSRATLHVLTELHPVMAQRLLAYPDVHQKEIIAIKELNTEDILIVAAGEQIPADGIVLQGHSQCDEAMMTGEAKPVTKLIDTKVMAGSINIHSTLVVRAEQVGNQTQLASMLGMMENAAKEKPPLVALADKHASYFLMSILGIALISFLVWWQIDADRALLIAISVIVVTCPCALSLATPGVMSAAVGNMAKHGMLVAKPKAIESLAQATHFVFDKTGTLTHGKLQLSASLPLSNTNDTLSIEEQQLAFALASLSIHPVAKTIANSMEQSLQINLEKIKQTQNLPHLTHIQEIAGMGIEAQYLGQKIRLGQRAFVQEICPQSIQLKEQYANYTQSFLANENGAIATFILEDSIREEAVIALKKLQKAGCELYLFSGDNPAVVKAVADALHIKNYQGGMSPIQKYQQIKLLQTQGKKVVMVGDGMNDGPALSLANVSIAMGQGAPISQTRSDLLLMSNRLLDCELSVRITKKAMHLIHQNLGWAIAYNAIAIPAAVTGLLQPWHAALGMSLSSIIVVVNGLRLLNVKADY